MQGRSFARRLPVEETTQISVWLTAEAPETGPREYRPVPEVAQGRRCVKTHLAGRNRTAIAILRNELVRPASPAVAHFSMLRIY